VSRGLGPAQWRVLKVLEENKNEGLPVRELKSRMGRDRSNARRTIRGLLKRGFVEEIEPNGERRLRLTLQGRLRAAYPLPKKQPSPLAEYRRERREIRRAMTEERARREADAAKGPLWFRYQYRFARRRLPGPAQKRILAALWEYADPVDEGLAIPAVKAIVDGDRANTRRAIRTLLLRGEIEESEDGRCIRLAFGTALWFTILPPILLEPIDEERARAILQAHQGSQVVA
jgi:DNA-binding MarR family transcriptional regulator